MSTTRTTSPVIWYELMTSDHKAALPFYAHVFGWTLAQNEFTSPEYTIVNAGTFNVGGLMTLPAEACAMGARPCWMMYLGVDDTEAAIARITAAGGKLQMGPQDVPGVGRFAVVADAQGAHFYIMKPISTEPLPQVPDGTLGVVGWRELHANDGEQAMAWYAAQFGWKQVDSIDMGAMGQYRLFTTDTQAEGGIMTRMPDTPVPFWTFYFNVGGIDAAVERVTSKGGQILMAPHQVPTGQWIAYCSDPQGAMFGMLSEKR